MILYVTTFNNHLYNATGRNMLHTFVEHYAQGDLLICHEGVEDIPKYSRFIRYDLNDDDYLQTWLQENKDIIPKRLGGEHDGNYQHKFHERTSEWFRKIAALHHAVSLSGYDKIVFLDCDVVIKQHISEEFMNSVFDGASMFYHYGPTRHRGGSGFETGIMGFDLRKQGGVILQHVFDKYADKSYRGYMRWDDAWMMTVAVAENPDVQARDLVERVTPTGHVVEAGILAPYLTHNKGVHWKKHGV